MRKIAVYGIIIFQIVLIASLIRGIQSSHKSKERLADLETRKEELVVQNEKLKEEQKYVQSDYYLEKVAREELHLVKPGETVVIMPEDSVKHIADSIQKGSNELDRKNWEKWWELLVK